MYCKSMYIKQISPFGYGCLANLLHYSHGMTLFEKQIPGHKPMLTSGSTCIKCFLLFFQCDVFICLYMVYMYTEPCLCCEYYCRNSVGKLSSIHQSACRIYCTCSPVSVPTSLISPSATSKIDIITDFD
jgi:hypothetical protein